MNTVSQVAEAMSTVLNVISDAAGYQSGFVQRRSKLTGARFVRTLVFGWLKNPQASLEELTQITAALHESGLVASGIRDDVQNDCSYFCAHGAAQGRGPMGPGPGSPHRHQFKNIFNSVPREVLWHG